MMREGKIIEISDDIFRLAKAQHKFDYYLMIKLDLTMVAIVGDNHYYRVESSKGKFVWNHMMMDLYLGYEVNVDIRYDFKIKIDTSEAIFEIIESSIDDDRCTNKNLLYIWNKIMEKEM